MENFKVGSKVKVRKFNYTNKSGRTNMSNVDDQSIGHGSIIFMSKPSQFKKYRFFERPKPEFVIDEDILSF